MAEITLETLHNDIRHIMQSVDEAKKYNAEQFGAVKARQEKTNGRVTALERDKLIRDAQWRIYRNIALWSSGVAASVAAALIVWYFTHA